MRLPRAALIVALATSPFAFAPGCARQEPATRVTLRTQPLGLDVFDRLIVDVRSAGQAESCPACRRSIVATELSVSGQTSFDIVAEGPAPTVRVSLERGRVPQVRSAAQIAVTATFSPEADAITVDLPYLDLGVPRGTWTDPVVLAAGAGSSLGPAPVITAACAGDDDPAQACVPGGVFWLGDPSLDLIGGVDREGNDEHLVVLSPFWLDRVEVTVGALRAAEVATFASPFRNELNRACTYTGAPGDNEALPVNCVIWPVADAFCRSRGARLPTEAELEYVMGGLRSRRHVWGDAPVECADAGIGGKDCSREGVAESGRFPRDKLVLGERTIVDLVGNLAEWTADRWNSTAANEACFRDHVLRDPRCDEDGVDRPGRRVVKGSGWDLDLVYTGAAFRLGVDGERAYNASVGFRCARDGAPR